MGNYIYEMVCPRCGFKGFPEKYTKGSFAVELGLWIIFLLPGLIYSIWRLASRYYGCPSCGEAHMLPLDSPMAQKILQNIQPAA